MDTSTYVFLALVMPLIGSLQQVEAPVPVSLQVRGQGERLEGQPYNLTCVVTPAPASDRDPVNVWFKDGGVLENRVERVLTFERLSAKDSGNYQCMLYQAGNTMASFSEDLALRVQNPGHRPIVVIQGQMIMGGDLLLSCFDSRPLSSGKSLYLWFRNGVKIRTEPNRDFTLSNVSYEDDGDYTCQVQETESGDTTLPSNKAAVFINIPPEVFIKEATGEVYKIAEGNNLSLKCLVSNEPKPSVAAGDFIWTVRHISSTGNASDLSDREVSLTDPSQSLYSSSQRADHQLTIVGANRSHSGLYTCHASNDPEKKLTVKPASACIKVQVLYLEDTVTVKLLTKESLVTGSKITLTCTADSLPTATLTWLHQGNVLHTTKGNSDLLTITASGCRDSGDYECRADNSAANKSAYGFVTVTVECPPMLATNVKVGEPIEVRGTLGQEVILSVPVSGTPPLVYFWTGPGVTPSNNRSPAVRLFPLSKSHAGLYSVKVSNKYNFVLQRLQVTVLEEGPPMLATNVKVGEPIEVRGTLGQEVILSVPVSGTPPLVYFWTGPGVTPSNNRSPAVRLFPLSKSHAGLYSVKVSNKYNFVLQRLQVTVLEEGPPTLAANVKVGEPIEVRGTLGQEVILSVPVSGTPPLVYFWTGPGVTPSNNRSPTVRFFPLSKSHAGLYIVKVSNKYNFVLQGLQVIVLEEEPKSGGEVTLWLPVVGGVAALILCLALLIALLRCRRSRNQRSNESRDTVGHQIRERTMVDYTYSSGDSSGHYWSIDSADVSHPSQVYQSGDSLIQSEVFSANEDPIMTRRPGLQDGESDPESEDGESYMVCEVLSPGLPPRSQASQSCDSKTQPDKTLYMDMSGKSQ